MRKIIVVENDVSWRNNLETLLRGLGEDRELIKLDLDDFTSRYQKASDFDDVDCALVDLELTAAVKRDITDIYGLEKVLPRIRQLAPWLPVACISRFISGDPYIIGLLSVSDFDGFYPKECIFYSDGRTDHNFNLKRWNSMLQELSVKRIAGLTSKSVTEIRSLISPEKRPTFIYSQKMRESIADYKTDFEIAISAMGFGGSKIACDVISGGFSGISVSKITSFGTDNNGKECKSYWVLKHGAPTSKVYEEAKAHRDIFLSGLHRKHMIPTLHNNVFSWAGAGYLAYAFEKEAVTAHDLLQKDRTTDLPKLIAPIVADLYRVMTVETISAHDLVEEWFNLKGELKFPEHGTFLRNTAEVTFSTVHGDLHLRNILVNGIQPTLIDFAKSKYGPIATDAAKTISDVLIFGCESRITKESLHLESLLQSNIAKLAGVFMPFLNAEGDKVLLDVSLRAYLYKYMKYPDIPLSKKGDLMSVFRSGVAAD